jgi:hypothetical protein
VRACASVEQVTLCEFILPLVAGEGAAAHRNRICSDNVRSHRDVGCISRDAGRLFELEKHASSLKDKTVSRYQLSSGKFKLT